MDKENNRTTVANAEKIAVMANDIQYIKLAMDEIKKLIADIKDSYVTKEVMADIERRVSNLESNQTWAARTVLGSIITTVISAAIAVVALIKTMS